MAAIVSQFAAGNRRKKKDALYEISNDKSVYFLPPFDPCFDPKKHNAYMRSQAAFQQKKILGAFLEPRRDVFPSPVSPMGGGGGELSLAEFLRLEIEEDETDEDEESEEEDPIIVISQVDLELKEISALLEEGGSVPEEASKPCCFLFEPANFEILRRIVIAICCLFSLSPFLVFLGYVLLRILQVD